MPSFDAYLHAYVAELVAHRFSDSYLAQAHRYLPLFFRDLKRQRVRDLRAVNEEHLTSFARQLQLRKIKGGGPMSLAYQAIVLRIVCRFFGYLDKRNLILRNPATYFVPPKVRMLPRLVLTEAQARRLVSAPSEWTDIGKRDRAVLEVLYGSGLRLSECARLDVGDLEQRQKTLLIRNGKGRKDRVVPVPRRAAIALDIYLRDARPTLLHDPKEPALFLTRGGVRVKRITIYALVRTYGKAAGVKVYPHALRHSCATHLLRGGADVRHVQKLLGHTSLESTMIYTRVDTSELAKILERAHPRAAKK